MKQKIFLLLLAFGLAAMVSAQGWGRMAPRSPDGNTAPRHGKVVSEPVTVSGGLVLAHGFPAVKSGDVIYMIGRVNRLSGFIDGFKEGAQVTIEGKAVTSPRDSNLKFIRPIKLTLNGKDYDFSRPHFFGDSRNQWKGPDGRFAPDTQRQRFQEGPPPGRMHGRFL